MLKKPFTMMLSLVWLGMLACGDADAAKQETPAVNGESVEEKHAEEVHLPPERVRALGITIEALQTGSVNSSVRRPATILFNPDRTVRVGPRISGKVERVHADLGTRVERGDTLAVLSSVELGKVRANYLAQLAKYETRRAHYDREKSLYREKISSEAEYLEAKARFKQAEADLNASLETLKLYGVSPAQVQEAGSQNGPSLSYFSLKSPIGGVVQERNLAPGETISPEDTPLYIVDARQMWVMIDAYEKDMTKVKKGQRVDLTVSSLPGERFTGKVDWISQSLDEKTRTLRVRSVVENTNSLLKNGMYGTAHIRTESEEGKPIIPVNAVQTIGNEQVVFVVGDEQGSFRPVPVVTGSENNGWIEIASNLEPGSRVVTDGAFHLKAILTARTRSAAHGH